MSFKVIASKGRHKVVAFNAIQQGIGPSGASMSTAALLGTNLKSGLLEGIIEESSNQEIQAIYRDIYFHDPIAGAAVDLKANLPWSDFNLIGATEDQIKVFMDTIERLNLKTLHVEMSTDQMVSGAFLGSLVYKNGGFSDVIPFDYAYANVTPNPLYSEDPVIQVEVSPELKAFVNSNIPAVKEIHNRLPQDIMTALRTAKEIDLDPLSTIYLPRTSLSTIQTGVSYFRRILPLYLIERVLYRGTLSEVTRRQRSTLHITAGDEDWIPTSEELSEIVGLFQSTEMDPISSVVATRNSIQTNEIRCLAYDTLIATNEGLITIEDLYKGKHIEGNEVKTHLSALNHKGEFAKIDTVIYQGKKPVLNVTLADGTTLRPTANHKFLTVDANLGLTLKTIQDVEYVLKTTKVDARHNEYEFDLQYPDVEMRPANADIKLPKRMTPKLAYCLALIISEGYMSPSTVSIANSDLKILKRVKNFMKDVFNIEGVIKMADTKYSESVIRGVRRKFKSAHNLEFYTKSLTGVLEQMGIIISSELSTDTHSSSYLKQVPDCILQADRESQLAFLSGYIDGDGGTKNYESRAKQGNDLIWRSTSHQIVKSIHAMLCEMGYLSKLYLGNVSAHECSSVTLTWGEFYKILPHLKCIKLQNKELASSRTYGQGIPGNLIYDALKSRDVTKRNEKVNGQRGSVFLSDTGARVFIPGGYATLVAPFKNNTTCMSYDNFKAGKYNKLLTIIQKVSNRLYKNLMNILNNEYAFVEVASIEEGPTVSTYDLHMDESNAPLFCINGNIITKNSAGDFFKWTDVADQLSFMKMRALGINESFLSGDASYNCVSGDTLIPTENGLLRIDQLCNENDGSIQEIKVKVGSITKPDYARSWHYNGVKPTLTVKTKQGNAVTGTPKHPLLVLNESGDLQWKPLSQMNIGDMLCINPRSITRTKKLAVNVKYKGHTIKYMTPDLAFLLGALLSDGHITKDGLAVRFGNTNERFFDRVVELVNSSFGDVHHTRNDIKAGTETRLKGSIRNKDCRVAVWSSKDLVTALNDLGLVFTRTEKTQSTTLNVPWSIMQADKESQCAFLAGFIEGDGNVNAKLGEISIHSSSENCLSQIQAILNSHGHLVTKTMKGLTINKIDALALWEDIKEYMVSKDIGDHKTRWRYNYGVPQQWFLDIIQERKVRSNTGGTIYLDDEGNEVKVSLTALWSCKALGGPIFSYDKYEQGLYKDAFALLSRISKKAVDKLKRLLSLRYHYTPIVSIEDSGLQKVYDLSMNSPLNVVLKGGDTFRFPSFIVNGLVGSNTMEVAMSTFIEDLRTYRERETRRLYYDKLFPLIAVANNFYKEENKTMAARLQTTGLMKTLNDTNNLVIPEVHWHKPLQPEADQSYMEILSTLEDKGLPVPLRMWAAAGGYNLDKILADQEADADISKKVEEYKKAVNSNTEEASLRAMAGLRPQHFLNRDYGEAQEIVGYTVTGKKKYIHNQKLANEKINTAAAKALNNLADPNVFQAALKRGKK